MDIQGIQSGIAGIALFDLWYASVKKARRKHRGYGPSGCGSPLVAAAANAFEAYVHSVELQNAAQIAALAPQALTPKINDASLSLLATYTLSPNGLPQLVASPKDLAPLYALNLLA